MQAKTLLHSKPRALLLPFIGALLLSTFVIVTIAMYDASRMGVRMNEANQKYLAFTLTILALAGAWYTIYKTMYPKKWTGSALIDLENRVIIMHPGTARSREIPFNNIRQIRYKAATSLFNTAYLFFIQVNKESEQPLLVLNNDSLANDLYFTLEKANIWLKQNV